MFVALFVCNTKVDNNIFHLTKNTSFCFGLFGVPRTQNRSGCAGISVVVARWRVNSSGRGSIALSRVARAQH